MLKVAPKSAPNPLRKSDAQAFGMQRSDRAGSITIPGIHPRDFLSFQALAVVLVAFYLVKSVLLSVYGFESYTARIELLLNGTAVEQVSGRLLDIDPLTAALSKIVSVVF